MTTPNQAAAIAAALARVIERRLAQGKTAKPQFCQVRIAQAINRVVGLV